MLHRFHQQTNLRIVCRFLSHSFMAIRHPARPPRRNRLPCLISSCPKTFKSQNGRTYHMRTAHSTNNIVQNFNRTPSQSLSSSSSSSDEDGHLFGGNHHEEDNFDAPFHHQSPPLTATGSRKTYQPHLTGKCSNSFKTSYSNVHLI